MSVTKIIWASAILYQHGNGKEWGDSGATPASFACLAASQTATVNFDKAGGLKWPESRLTLQKGER